MVISLTCKNKFEEIGDLTKYILLQYKGMFS